MTKINYQAMSDQQLLNSAKGAVKREKGLTTTVLDHLQEVERRRAYCDLGISSLFRYCVEILDYSEAEASYRVNATRLVAASPLAKKEIKRGKLSLSSASKITQHLKNEQKHGVKPTSTEVEEIVRHAKGRSTRQLEVMLDQISTTPKEKSQKVMINQRVQKKIEKIRQSIGDNNASDVEIIEMLLNDKLATIAKLKQQRQSKRRSKNPRYIDRQLREEVMSRSGGRCEHVTEEGKRCRARLHLQIDHRTPIALGGKSTSKNLRHLCFAHNQRAAIKIFGIEKIGSLSTWAPQESCTPLAKECS
jgi:5-methylcytosine-specific restriction endonuclease McrA